MSEQDIEKLIENYNKTQIKNAALQTENTTLQTENATLKEEMALMQSQLDWFKKQMFGRKSEQSTVIFEGGEQLSFMPDEKAASAKEAAFDSVISAYLVMISMTRDSTTKTPAAILVPSASLASKVLALDLLK